MAHNRILPHKKTLDNSSGFFPRNAPKPRRRLPAVQSHATGTASRFGQATVTPPKHTTIEQALHRAGYTVERATIAGYAVWCIVPAERRLSW